MDQSGLKTKLNKQIVLFVFMFLAISNLFATCTEKDLDEGMRVVNIAIQQSIKDTRSNILNGKTSKDIGQRIIDSLESRKTQLNELYLKIKFGSTDSLTGEENSSFKQSKFKIALGIDKEGKKTINDFTFMIVSTLRSIETMKRLYSTDKFTKFQSSLFFETGEYIIPPKNRTNVVNGLNPFLDKVFSIINNDTNSQAKIVIGVYGYSDEQDVQEGNKLYNDLSSRINSDKSKYIYSHLPFGQQLNFKLSQLRAESLKVLIYEELKRREEHGKDIDLLFEINWIGLGNEIPRDVENPKKNDDRRRIVSIYWDVLPTFKLDEKLLDDIDNIDILSEEYKKSQK
jgi:hypothetical protein